MEVSEAVKNAYLSIGKTKYIDLYFPELDLSILGGTGRMYSDSMYLSEKLVSSNSIEFVGCISSMFKIQVNNLKEDIKGKKITATIHTEGAESELITLFNGIVDSAMKQSNKRIKEIVAYDELYTKGSTDISAWYKSLTFPITLKVLRDSLFAYIGIEQVEIVLPNDNIEIKKQYNPSSLQALPVIKAICQINGVFGIINRNNKFEYRILGAIDSSLYTPFYPGKDVFPGISKSALGLDNIQETGFSFYKDVDYEEYVVKPVDKITIRQSEDNEGVTYGTGTNNYIIQGSMFTYGLSKDVLLQIAENIYPNVQGFSYRPFKSVNNGLPYLECGLDAVSYKMIDWENTESSNDIVYEGKSFYILNRELTGIQSLTDSYSAQGEEYQTEFVTDLQTQIDTLKKSVKQEVEDYTYPKEEIDNMIASSGGWNVESVPVLPVSVAANTIYLIQGEVTVE
ncbi:MAG: hypothetical protein K2N73_10600 [Lachnospiraceae bacterium]|nr:hypothetical protein [Lachnospiraceae bacterium]